MARRVRANQLIRLGHRVRNRFLDQQMHGAPGAGFRNRAADCVGSSDDHAFRFLAFEQFVDVLVKDGRIGECIVCGHSGPEALRAKQFIDTTGEADVARAIIAGRVEGTLRVREAAPARIARALAAGPRFILLDEPFAGVDPISVIEIQKIVEHLTDLDIGVLITDHNVRETLGICNRSYIVSEGRIIAEGRLADILKKHDRNRVTIVGHTDSVGSDESNMALAERRARSAFDYLRKAESESEDQGRGERDHFR